MFESAYQWTVNRASRILCALAFLMIAAGAAVAIYGFGRLGPDNEVRANWLLILNSLVAGVSNAVWPLIGAAALHRFDKSRLPSTAPENSN
jgi:hypothetical protein